LIGGYFADCAADWQDGRHSITVSWLGSQKNGTA
jgi:hypothetical protein